MRAIFYTLVVANLVALGVFLLQGGRTEPAHAPAVQAPEFGAAQLQLLGEQAGWRQSSQPVAPVPERPHVAVTEQSAAQSGAPARVTPEIATVERGPAQCTLVGPFKKHLPAEYFVEHLQARNLDARVVMLEVPGKPNYWVFQKPETSRKAALRRLHELQAKGIDSFVIPKGDLENGISFGVFSELKRAESLAAEIRGRGYAAEVRPRPRTFEEIWVSLSTTEAGKIAAESWLELLNREVGLEKRENLCPPVAS